MKTKLIAAIIVMVYASTAFAWSCANHTIIAKQAGLANENACVTDVRHDFTHYVNNEESQVVSEADFRADNTSNGELYAKIYVLSKQLYEGKKLSEKDKQDFVHLIGDLSNPMHNVVYPGFNQSHHKQYDGVKMSNSCIDKSLSYTLKTHKQFLEKVAEVAEAAKDNGYHDIDAKAFTFTKDEACDMASMSVALLKSVKAKLNK